jgi:hypothetical protein
VLDSVAGSPENYFVKSGYQARSEVRYCHRSAGSITSQEEVYIAARHLAERLGAEAVIDLGCGFAEKSLQHLSHLRIVGVDYGPNIAHCRTEQPEHHWLEVNLDQAHELKLPPLKNYLVICADVIEHMTHPEHLLKTLRQLSGEALAMVVSTPERDLERGCAHTGPPNNQAHAREWNMLEFQHLLDHWEIPATISLVRADRKATHPRTMLATTRRLAA